MSRGCRCGPPLHGRYGDGRSSHRWRITLHCVHRRNLLPRRETSFLVDTVDGSGWSPSPSKRGEAYPPPRCAGVS
eukprot:scaffold1339_cov207-Alexandrium_tamarense.AAC.12